MGDLPGSPGAASTFFSSCFKKILFSMACSRHVQKINQIWPYVPKGVFTACSKKSTACSKNLTEKTICPIGNARSCLTGIHTRTSTESFEIYWLLGVDVAALCIGACAGPLPLGPAWPPIVLPLTPSLRPSPYPFPQAFPLPRPFVFWNFFKMKNPENNQVPFHVM